MTSKFEKRLLASFRKGNFDYIRDDIEEVKKEFLKFKKQSEMVEPYFYVQESIEWFDGRLFLLLKGT